MSILTQLRQFFGRGIRMTMDLPQDFAWEDKVIPFTLHIASDPGQPHTAAQLRFHLYDEEKGTRSNSGTERGVNYRSPRSSPAASPSARCIHRPICHGSDLPPRSNPKGQCSRPGPRGRSAAETPSPSSPPDPCSSDATSLPGVGRQLSFC